MPSTMRCFSPAGITPGLQVGAVIAPVPAAIGALIALMKDCTIDVERGIPVRVVVKKPQPIAAVVD